MRRLRILEGLARRRPLRPGRQEETAIALYRAVVAQAREPRFYTALRVPDTVDGRFELIVLHTFLVLHRLQGEGADAAALGRRVLEALFDDMDRSLREMGVGDLGVGRRVKAMARAFYGRVAAYDRGLASDDGALAAAVRRNLFGTLAALEKSAPETVAAYMRAAARHLAAQPLSGLLDGGLTFPAAEEFSQ